MTDRSQFILITHIKRTMQMVDVLYGVTMPEAGRLEARQREDQRRHRQGRAERARDAAARGQAGASRAGRGRGPHAERTSRGRLSLVCAGASGALIRQP